MGDRRIRNVVIVLILLAPAGSWLAPWADGACCRRQCQPAPRPDVPQFSWERFQKIVDANPEYVMVYASALLATAGFVVVAIATNRQPPGPYDA
jgi:hypothetical protein